jgi:hypothetical protein
MASKENNFFADVPKYEGQVYDIPVRSTGEPQTGEQSSLRNILENYGWVLPAVGIPAVGAYGAMKGYDLYQKNFGKESNLPDEETPPKKSIRDRFIGQPSTPPGPQTSIEKQLGGLDINTLPKDQRELINTLNDAERKRMAKQQTAINAINDASKGKIPLPENTMPTIELASPIKTTAPVAPVISPISTPEVPTVADLGKQAVGVAPVEAPATTTELADKSLTRKYEKKTFKPGEKLPEGMVFKEGFGGADNWMKNSFNDEARIHIRDLFNEGKPYGQNMDKAYADARRYESWLKENIPVQTYARGERAAAGLPPPENYGSLGKAVKVAGTAGLLMTLAQAANAKGNAGRNIANAIGEAVLPLGLTPSTLQTGTLPPEIVQQMMAERQKLGSPFRSVPPPQ